MKKLILGAVLFLATATTMQAQFLQIGAKAGVNFANLNGTDVQTDAITSYHAGLVAEIKLLDRFSIQPELLYSTQGATYKNALGEFKDKLGYLSIPVLAKIYLSDSFSLEAGPQASFLLSQKNDFDIKDAKTFDFALAAGLGFKVTKNIFIQGRYGLGLTEVSKDAKAKNSVFQLSAGFMF
ncbi:porin family protein [Flavobacterium branchiarum]|uniref:Porin family protein n=1 Tax=Flavobacterium branchiarum TaxID=1114870 RepID=A0ABV5FN32_9FLAO|nr:porin family protein [Flavobacterium branchiarum]MDN3672164.1 porin family protein [Flavobacterium branchiarum]